MPRTHWSAQNARGTDATIERQFGQIIIANWLRGGWLLRLSNTFNYAQRLSGTVTSITSQVRAGATDRFATQLIRGYRRQSRISKYGLEMAPAGDPKSR